MRNCCIKMPLKRVVPIKRGIKKWQSILVFAVAGFISSGSIIYAQTKVPSANLVQELPLPYDGIDYEFGEFKQERDCFYGEGERAHAVLERNKDQRVTLSIDNKKYVLNKAPAPNTMAACYRSITCRMINQKPHVAALQDLSCGRGMGGNSLVFTAIDLDTNKVTTINAVQAEKLGLFFDLIDTESKEYTKLFNKKSYENIVSISVMTQRADPLYISAPDQKNSFFSGSEHQLIMSTGFNLERITGKFYGNGEVGEFRINGPGKGKWLIKLTKVTTRIQQPPHIEGDGTLQIDEKIYKIRFFSRNMESLEPLSRP